MLKIGEFSTLTHTSVKTLRFYDAIGLLRPEYVDGSSRYRFYSAGQIDDLQLIQRLKRFGFDLRQIQRVMRERSNRDALQTMLREQRAELVRRLQDDRRRLSALDEWVQQLDDRSDAHPYLVAVKPIERQTIATIRESIRAYADAEDLFDELRHYLKSRRAARCPAAATWYTCGDSGGPVDCEAFVTIAITHRQRISSSRRIQVHERAAGLVASVVHHGRLDLTPGPGPYVAGRRWIAANGYCVAGPKRELYWRGSVGVNRASDITEIQFPIAVARC